VLLYNGFKQFPSVLYQLSDVCCCTTDLELPTVRGEVRCAVVQRTQFPTVLYQLGDVWCCKVDSKIVILFCIN